MTQPTPSSVEAKITTTNQVHGIRFDTNPGAIITLKASLGGIADGSFLFFVQDGKVNGGFTGKLQRTAHRRRQGKGHGRRVAPAPVPVSYWAFAVAFAVPLSPGRTTWTAGTFTVVSLLPTRTDPVSTSKAGAWPPLATMPFSVADTWGAFPPRTWLMSRKPVATAAMTARIAMIRMRMMARIGCLSFPVACPKRLPVGYSTVTQTPSRR